MEAMIQKFVMAIIGIVIIVTILGSTIGTVATSGNVVNATGYTGASLFASNGILPLIIIMGVLVGVVSLAFALWKKG